MNLLKNRASLFALYGTIALFSHPTFAAPVKPQISVSNAIVTEGNSGTVAAAFTVTLSGATTVPVNVAYATSNATAIAPNDYNAVGNTLTFAPGETSKTVNVAVKGDTIDEVNETFNFNLSNPTNATINDGLGIGSITDDDDPPVVSIGNASVSEGNSGTKTMTFTVRLSVASSRSVSVSAKTVTAAATATTEPAVAGTDYVALAATPINFAPGELVKTIGVTVNADTVDEADETFNLLISAPGNATLGTATGVGTITDDDVTPTIAINDVSLTEGDTGVQTATLTVSLSAGSGRTVKVTANTADSSATLAGADYVALPTSVLTFLPGQTSKTVAVSVRGDLISEATETFQLKLATPVNATIADSTGIVTILDNDTLPSISVAPSSVSEGNSGETSLPFVLKLSAASSRDISVKVQTSAATTDPATTGVDYVAVPVTTVTIPAGTTQQTFNVTVKGDTINEANEKIALNLSVPVYATLATTKVEGTIIDDDAAPTIIVIGNAVPEGNSGTTSVTFTISLTAPSTRTITASFKTINVGVGGDRDPNTALAGSDYVAVTGVPLSFAPGETSKTVPVTVNGDTLYEDWEVVGGNVYNVVNASIPVTGGTGAAIINNDDTMPVVSIERESRKISVTEGNSGNQTVSIKFLLSAVSGVPVTVENIFEGSATENEDYTLASPIVTFASGETSKTLDVVIKGDTKVEPTEYLSFYMYNVTGATPDGSYDSDYGSARTSTVLIVTENVEQLPKLSVQETQYVSEGSSGTKTASISVYLSKPVDYPVTVDYQTPFSSGPGIAVEGEDYVPIPRTTLTFAPGETSKKVEVSIIDDTVNDGDKHFYLYFDNPTGASTLNSQPLQSTIDILDDEETPIISVMNTNVAEGNSGNTVMNFTVQLARPTSRTVTVKYKTGKSEHDHYKDLGTFYPYGDVWYATEGVDYVAVPETLLTFAPGETTKTVPVTILGDTIAEIREDFSLILSDAVNAYPLVINGLPAIGIIDDNDNYQPHTPTISVTPSYTIVEGNTLEKTLNIPVSIPAALNYPVKVWFKTMDGTAVQGEDFKAITSSVVIEPGETTKNMQITIYGDTRAEANESFSVMCSTQGNWFPDGVSASTTITITNDDASSARSAAVSAGAS